MSFKSVIDQVDKLKADGNYKEAKEKLLEIDKETISEIEFIQYYRFQSKLYSRFGDYDLAIDTA